MEKNVQAEKKHCVRLLKEINRKLKILESMDLVTDEKKQKLEDFKALTKIYSDNCVYLDLLNNIILRFINNLEEPENIEIAKLVEENIVDKLIEETLKTIEKQARLKANTDLEMIKDTTGDYSCSDRLYNKAFNKFNALIKNIFKGELK